MIYSIILALFGLLILTTYLPTYDQIGDNWAVARHLGIMVVGVSMICLGVAGTIAGI